VRAELRAVRVVAVRLAEKNLPPLIPGSAGPCKCVAVLGVVRFEYAKLITAKLSSALNNNVDDPEAEDRALPSGNIVAK